MGKRARWILFGVVVLAAAGFGWVKLRRGHEPVARWPLPDGTELRLEQVTYGTHHVMRGAGGAISWLTKMASKLPRSRIPHLPAEYHEDTADPSPVLWFTCRDPRKVKLVTVPYMILSSNKPSFPARIDWLHSTWLPPLPNENCAVVCYDRRSPTFHMRVQAIGKFIEFDVKNPVAGAVFPEWQPEPLPQTRKVGKYDLVFRALRIEQSPAGTSQADPGFELFEAGQRVGDWDFSFSMSDATGNFTRRGVAWDMLPLTEPAWKLRVIVRVPGDLQVEKQAAEFIVAPPKLPEPKSGPGAR